ncbi:MAG: hypothetical protein JO348_06230 [Alphaproteobacteria bacterium]|nr:hypothetical protein [Alphaproteobacteria bacterium]
MPALDRRRWLGIAGIVLVAIGCLAPLADFPFGTVTFWGGGHGDGMFALGLAAVAGLLLYLKRYRLILLTAAAITAIWLLTYFRLADTHIANFTWGWLPLVIGTGCLFAAGLLPAQKPRA